MFTPHLVLQNVNTPLFFGSLLRWLGTPAVRHSFRQGNKVGDRLSKQGLKYGTYDQPSVLLSPPTSVTNFLEADKQGVTTPKLVSISSCNSLASLGNLSVLAINDSTSVTSSSYVTT
ncbi:uncharacterized protein LOC132622964 isoform X2 [Lycium barbarum]|uniref:uncharacterized protein LOC132622964 isoform X2 n=1 Tax=Lycium barbarum TaxID=112863 RepID=UPI00293ECB3C|nr:uncharacterized protein LOC132622964 isoform X2 [Lycium barbarum]